jgi:sulfatase modifying factor 1
MRRLAFAMALLAAACSSDDPATCGDASSCPAGMTLVSANCGSFCTDSTEVTREQYAQFLAQAPPPAGQPEACAWNVSFESSCPLGEVPGNDPSLPITCVDWCDAGAYCAWAGKRLCTGLGGPPTRPVPWDAACEAVFGYLDADPPGCNLHSGAMKPVGTSVGCSGKSPPLDGLFDLIGNAAEWTDACSALDDVVHCSAPGASALNGAASCSATVAYEPTYRDPFVGFRCCKL